jgi:flagellar assembly factor FliW
MTDKKNVSTLKEFDPEKVFTFPKGIPGFETYTKFIIFHKEENETGVYWFESLDKPKVTFTLVDPTLYGLSYELLLSDEEQAQLELDDPKTAAVLLILTKNENKDTGMVGLNANIAGPVIINVASRRGIQKVITKTSSSVKIVPE